MKENILETNKVYRGDALNILKTFPSESVDCVVTSPPYYGLRDYRVSGQIGQEKTPEAYTKRLVDVFREVKRALRSSGTFWLNLGDSYWAKRRLNASSYKDNEVQRKRCGGRFHPLLKPKDIVGIPWRVAFALQADGWYLRQDIIWAKPNPMPESVTDRCVKSHEYIFLLTKSPRYFFDYKAIQEVAIHRQDSRAGYGRLHYRGKRKGTDGEGQENFVAIKQFRNKRSVWTVNVKPFSGLHFATFPEEVIAPMILAGCPRGGVVLDTFFGAGTTGLVAQKSGRKWIGIEINPDYCEMAKKRIGQSLFAF